MKNKSKNKLNASSEKMDKEKQPIKYGDREWQNPQYGEKNDSSTDKSCGCWPVV